MAIALRELAAKLETTHEALEFDVQVHVWSHLCSSVRTIEELRSVYAILENPEAGSNKGRHRSQWIEGKVGPITVTAHYAPGLLGKTRKARFVEKDVEVSTDISVLVQP